MDKHLYLSSEKAAAIHEAACQVLEKTGVKLDNKEAEALYLEAGVKKDDEGRILITRTMVEEALEKAEQILKFSY